MSKAVYQRLVPEKVRLKIWRMRQDIPRKLHDLRWRLANPAYIARWTEKKLALGEYFWLFILGCNNSGTTLLLQLLESHPRIRSLHKEGQFATEALPKPPELDVGRLFTKRLDIFRWTEQDDATFVPRIRYDWARQFDPAPGMLLEKSPTNTLRSRWLQRNFQPCRFITIVRIPYAVCEGICRRKGVSIAEAATHWKLVHEILGEDMTFLEHCFLFRYEDFCESPEKTLTAIAEFLELEPPFSRDILGKTFRTHNMDNTSQVIQNFNARSLERLSAQDIETINRIAGNQMQRFGYALIHKEKA